MASGSFFKGLQLLVVVYKFVLKGLLLLLKGLKSVSELEAVSKLFLFFKVD